MTVTYYPIDPLSDLPPDHPWAPFTKEQRLELLQLGFVPIRTVTLEELRKEFDLPKEEQP